jgi:hypothetical protein
MRLHPFDLAFGPLVDQHFTRIADEAEQQRRALEDLAQFGASPEVQHLLQEIEAPDVIAASPEAGVEYLQSLFVAYRFWRAGQTTHAIARDALEAALAADAPETLPTIPGGGVYLQLPENWFWAQVDAEAPHEPLDGCFVVSGAEESWTVLAVLGLRADRSGFSQVALMAPTDDVLSAPSMARTPPFAPLMEGGASVAFRSVGTLAELLHLALLGAATVDDPTHSA